MKKIICILVLLCIIAFACFSQTEDTTNDVDEFFKSYGIELVPIPYKEIKMLNTEVTQKLFKDIVGANQSSFKGDNRPVDSVSWYDAIYFCNLLSYKLGLQPVYLVDGKPNVEEWKYKPLSGRKISKKISYIPNANGFRLPTYNEWMGAAFAGHDTNYAGSNNIDEVAWHGYNSDFKTHDVAQKKPNAYRLYDMTGNVLEWIWEDASKHPGNSLVCGGSYNMYASSCMLTNVYRYPTNSRENMIGFRIVCLSYQ